MLPQMAEDIAEDPGRAARALAVVCLAVLLASATWFSGTAAAPFLRQALEDGNWHILKSNHLRTFAAREVPSLADLEPFLGLDPPADRTGEQMPLFE